MEYLVKVVYGNGNMDFKTFESYEEAQKVYDFLTGFFGEAAEVSIEKVEDILINSIADK